MCGVLAHHFTGDHDLYLQIIENCAIEAIGGTESSFSPEQHLKCFLVFLMNINEQFVHACVSLECSSAVHTG